MKKRKRQYLVKWAGYGDKESTVDGYSNVSLMSVKRSTNGSNK
jgi:hypothetical protein